jgi:hypothetical protein
MVNVEVIAPLILNLNTRWRQAARFTTRPLYPQETSPAAPPIGKCLNPRGSTDDSEKRKIPCLYGESKHHSPVYQPVT